MATTIKLKNGTGVPSAGSLVVGEPALDLTNKRLYTEDSGGTVIEVGTNPSTINIDAGTIDGTVIGGSTAAAGSFTTFTSTGIDDNAASTAITIDSSQNVGIGTSSPQRQLHVSKNANNTHIAIERDGTDNPSALILGANQNKTEIISSAAEESTSGVPLTFLTGNTERMRLDASGNVGIGTSSPNFYTGQTTLNINSAGVARLDLDIGNTMQGYLLAESGYTGLFTPSGSNSLRFGTNNTERMRIDSSGNVGIGVANGDVTNDGSAARTYVGIIGTANRGRLNIGTTASNGADAATLAFTNGANTLADIIVDTTSGVQNTGNLSISSTDYLRVLTSGSERMRIDSSGSLLVGKTATGIGTVGAELKSTGELLATVNNDACAFLNRKSSDGDIAVFRKDNTTVGSIGTISDDLVIYSATAGHNGLRFGTGQLLPTNNAGTIVDNAVDLGDISFRFDDIYATNGTIQTSDRNEKQDIEALSDAEQRVAVAAKGLLRKFRWIDSVEEKGDDARIHFGIIAQDLQDAFTAEGLDAGRYAMFISSTWWESTEVIPAVEAQEAVVDEEGNVVEEAVEAQEERTVVHTHDTAEEAPEGSVERTRLGVRYPQLLAFIIAAI
jgi:hypothetical protein